MSSFTTPLIGEWDTPMIKFTLFQEFKYVGNDGVVYRVPKGFITDFASIPKYLHIFFSPIGLYGKAAVLHDYLYSSKVVTKEKADRLFREAMFVLKVPRWKMETFYIAVKYFGGKEY